MEKLNSSVTKGAYSWNIFRKELLLKIIWPVERKKGTIISLVYLLGIRDPLKIYIYICRLSGDASN